MRSEGNDSAKANCEDALVKLACATDSDDCPAECRDNGDDDSDKVVKSGDLVIKATPSSNRRAVGTGVSDLDTITLKASEAITLNSITLERYGYSDGDSVKGVWLEDANGTQITNPKTLSKDKVTLTLKKDYKELDSTDDVTIVVELKDAEGTIGFKVTDVDASAKNLDISDYDPYTYEIVNYNGATIVLTQKGKDDKYNYSEGEKYEVQRFKAKADSTPITVNGFTLKNEGGVDIKDGVEKVEVTVNDEKVENLEWDINSKKELKVNFDGVEIATRESAIFAVNFVFVKGFDELNKTIKLSLAKTDFNAVEKKTGARVTVSDALVGNEYTIRGGKITLTNKKLGTVEASAETDDVLFGEGEISVGGQAIILNPFQLSFAGTATANGEAVVKNVRIVVNGDEISSSCTTTPNNSVNTTTVCKFEKTIDVDEDGKIQFLADLTKYADSDTKVTVTPSSFGKTTIKNGAGKANTYVGSYDDANENIQDSDFVGTIDLNEIKVQTPRASLENTKSKTVEFAQGKSDTQTIFEGKYTAKNKDVYLNSIVAISTATTDETAKLAAYDELAIKVFVNDKEVATTDVTTTGTTKVLYATEDFSKVLVKAKESVNVRVDVKAYPKTQNSIEDPVELNIIFNGEDENGDPAGEASDTATLFKVVKKGSVSVSDSIYETTKDFQNNSVSLKKSNATLAKFDLKPSKSSTTVDLDNFCFSVSKDGVNITTKDSFRVKVAGKNTLIDSYDSTKGCFMVNDDLDETLEGDGVTVEISTKGTPDGEKYVVTLVNINSAATDVNKVYNQYVLPVKVTFAQRDMGGSTKFTAEMDQGDNDVEINKIDLYVGSSLKGSITSISENSKGEVEISADKDSTLMIDKIVITTDQAGTPLDSCIVTVAGKTVDITDSTTVDSTSCTTAMGTPAAAYDTTSGTCIVTVAGKTVDISSATIDDATKCTTAMGTPAAAYSTIATNVSYEILKSEYSDYFRVGDTYLKIAKA